LRGVAPCGLVVVVVVGEGQAPGRISPVVVVAVTAATHCRAAVGMVMVKGKMMTHIQTRFLGLTLDPGQTQGYV